MTKRYTGEVVANLSDIFLNLYEYDRHDCVPELTNFKFEHLIEEVVRRQVPMDITLEDFTLYVGAMSSLIWMNRERWINIENVPMIVSVKQRPNGCFKTKVID
jgi:hypothetical protein